MPAVTDKKLSYDRVLESTSIMGGAAGINMLLGLLRVKTAAILIGSLGVGLIANFTIIHGLIGAVAGLGLQTSAVKDVVEAQSASDPHAVANISTITVRMCAIVGLFGLAITVLLSKHISIWTFGDTRFSIHIACLGLLVLWGNMASGYQAIIQGFRRIDFLARISILTSILGTCSAISLYFLLGIDGVIPAILVTSLIGLFASWIFYRKLELRRVEVTWGETFREAGGMIRLGSAMMIASVIILIGKYITNALVTNQISLEAVGLYSAAFAISTILVDFVLNAMNADYYPRLIAASSDNEQTGNLISEQIEAGLLIVTPGLIFTLAYAPWVMEILYAEEFLPAVNLLNWLVIGSMASVLGRPTGYILIALGKGRLFVLVSMALQGSYVIFLIYALEAYGLMGSAIAFVLLRLLHVLIMMLLARHFVAFSLPRSSDLLVLKCVFLLVTVFLVSAILPAWIAACAGTIALLLSIRFSLVTLGSRLSKEHKVSRLLDRVASPRRRET